MMLVETLYGATTQTAFGAWLLTSLSSGIVTSVGQPSLLALLASGDTPVYPCHVSPAEMRTHPIGTGPFKFVEFKVNESIKLTRNLDYWKKGLPYLDGIEFTIIPNRSTAILAFIAGKFLDRDGGTADCQQTRHGSSKRAPASHASLPARLARLLSCRCP